MPAFVWTSGGVMGYQWNDEPLCQNEFFYDALRALEFVDTDGELSLAFRMYSAIETRWVNVETFEVVSKDFPFFDVEEFYDKRRILWDTVRQHAQGYLDIRNPCAEIPLGGSEMGVTCQLLPWTPADMGSPSAYNRR